MFGWFDKAVQKGAEKGVSDAIRNATKPGGVLDQAIDKMVEAQFQTMAAENARYTGRMAKPEGFVWCMAMHCMRRMTITSKDAFADSWQAFRDFLADEKIAFHDPDYDWTQAGAEDLAQELIIDYAEASQ